MMIPNWMKANSEAIDTGYEQLDSVIKSVLSNPAIIGGGLACIMDNTIPGTLKERGLIGWQVDLIEDDDEVIEPTRDVETNTDQKPSNGHLPNGNVAHTTTLRPLGAVYDLPFLPKSWKASKCFTKLPFMPGYRQTRGISVSCCKAKSESHDLHQDQNYDQRM